MSLNIMCVCELNNKIKRPVTPFSAAWGGGGAFRQRGSGNSNTLGAG
jgi:hypothetical protein